MIRFKIALLTDERVRFMDEIISGVQVIKMYAWERPFEKLIAVTRKLELKSVLKNSYVRAFYMTVSLFTTRFALFCAVLSFVYLYGSENITVSKIFMAAYLYNIISILMSRMFIRGISDMGEALIALKRLQKFLEYEERTEIMKCVSDITISDDISISMRNVSTEWTGISDVKHSKKSFRKTKSNKNPTQRLPNNSEKKNYESFKLQEINLEVAKGKLTFVVGSVGAGKSTLLHALLKELPLISGSMIINGSVSFASQESWLFTSTIRQNITFGEPMDRLRYDEIINSTALTLDLSQFSDGDMTLVGEHGAGLSGGQKARIK